MNLIDQLYDAYHGGPHLSRDESTDVSLPETYALQRELVAKEEQQGNGLKGYKISLTSEETQNLFGADEPLYGALLQDSIAEDAVLLDGFNEPLIEVELMFLIDEPINATDDEQTVLDKTRIAPGIEIPDSRYLDWFPNLTLHQIVMDRAVAGKVVVGEPQTGLTKADLNDISVNVTLNDRELITGESSDVMGNPLNAVMWLKDTLAQTGRQLEPGMVVSSGTFMLPKPLEEGKYRANFDKVGEVRVTVK